MGLTNCLKANNLAKADLRDVRYRLALCANLDSAYMQTGSKNRLRFPNSHVMHVPYFCAVLSKNSIHIWLVGLNLWVFSCTLFQHRHHSTGLHSLFIEGFFSWAPPPLFTKIRVMFPPLCNCLTSPWQLYKPLTWRSDIRCWLKCIFSFFPCSRAAGSKEVTHYLEAHQSPWNTSKGSADQ